jgi:hypothetical protein
MFRKLIRFCFVFGVISLVIGVCGFIAANVYFTHTAKQKAASIIKTAGERDAQTPDQELIEIARIVFERFEEKWPSEVPLLRISPYVSNSRLPEFIKFSEGVIETYIATGMCDNAARMLHFVLKQKGYDSVQWNMVSGANAHSALLVYMPDGREVLLDPFYGYVGYDKDEERLLSPEEMRIDLSEGKPFEEVFLPLGDKARSAFYKDFQFVRMAPLGEDLNIIAMLPRIEAQAVFLGEINGDNKDVMGAASANSMTPFWHYAGHKYDRSWVRVLSAVQDVRLEMTLLSDVEEGVITSDPRPQIQGNKMVWNLKAGDEIKFYDGRAKINWRRLNSFIGIDQIAIYPILP